MLREHLAFRRRFAIQDSGKRSLLVRLQRRELHGHRMHHVRDVGQLQHAQLVLAAKLLHDRLLLLHDAV